MIGTGCVVHVVRAVRVLFEQLGDQVVCMKEGEGGSKWLLAAGIWSIDHNFLVYSRVAAL